mmetsp:Transcript_24189/g.42982  ORF Transcript_24189/g.42982 Transcript_24189/m.42982 type:complete len:739 (-) Transcript_24189:28-2244(-)
MEQSSTKQLLVRWAPVLRIVILAIICCIAFLVRIFSVIRFESIIHEFDPWFNYRTTKYLTSNGLYEFWNWFDAESWFPLGRVTGGTMYPGLMLTAAAIHKVLHFLAFPVDIRNVCVFTAPVFSAFTALATYGLTAEVTRKTEAGLLSALFIAIVPSYISRSVAGSYDYEGISIFILILTFYLFVRSVRTGSLLSALLTSLSYFYMVASWGGYTFIINIIPVYVIGMQFIGQFTKQLYVAYTAFYVMGSLLAMQIPFVGFQVVTSSEHLASHAVFFYLQVYMLSEWFRAKVGEQAYKSIVKLALIFAASVCILYVLFVSLTGRMRWSGRSMSLLDPTYAKKFIPIIASVSEHQPTTWASFFFDTHFLIAFAPVGFYYCLINSTPGKLFVALYGLLAVYFASVMVRLLLVLAPALCILSGIGLSETLHAFTRHIRYFAEWKAYQDTKNTDNKAPKPAWGMPLEISAVTVAFVSLCTVVYICHCTWVAAEAYSSPTIIMASKSYDGKKRIIDDYREAYSWLRLNSDEDSRIMSWWDYGYQLTGMANRTVMVDNNTWNNTHIATMGMIFASEEDEAARMLRNLDVDYVLVIFGGMAYYSGDDINKFLWMIRIASGVFPQVKEDDFLNAGSYRIDAGATPTMKSCLMYRLSYYRFGEAVTSYGKPPGYDVVRNVEVGDKNIKLKHFEEVYTSAHWIVRIFRLLPEENRGDVVRPRGVFISKDADILLEHGLTTEKSRPEKAKN